MPMYLVERSFAESFDPDGDVMKELEAYYEANDIRWITSFLSSDQRKSYCLYEAANPDLLRKHADDMGVPLDSVVEVDSLKALR